MTTTMESKPISPIRGTSNASAQSVMLFWKDFNLENRKTELDTQATEIADNRDGRVNARKKLAEQTKTFKKLQEEEKVQQIGPLLKLYQDEIDQLTKRCKFSETAFLGLYKLLADAPDPMIALNAAQEELQNHSSTRIVELEIENKKFKTELEEFRKDFQEIKNQEVTIRRLEDKLAEYESKMEEIVSERINANQELLEAEQRKTLDAARDKENELRRQVTQLQEDLNKLHHALEISQSELLDMKGKHDEKQLARQSELEMLSDELERARTRILVLEREREKYLEKAEHGKGNSFTTSNTADLELEVAQKDIEISHLRDQIHKLESSLSNQEASMKTEIAKLSDQLNKERASSASLRKQLQDAPNLKDHEELKNELEILKSALEYNDSEEITDSQGVEKLLKEKNRKLETENMQLKVSLSEKAIQLQGLNEKCTLMERSESDLKLLVAKLEEDITRGYANQKEDISEILQVGNSKKGTKGEDVSMLQIVCSQRDRFKLRIGELEVETRTLAQQLQNKDNEISGLREDNIKLYEKIKYLQSYGSRSNRDLEANKRDDDIDVKYSKLYEDSVNPFVAFNRKEKYRRYKELNPAERVILSTGRFFLSTKFSRTFLFVYSVVLHLLVFMTLYKLAHTTCTISTT